MGWRFRRRRSVGPFRFTVSKRGVGASGGAGGVRVGASPGGRRWLSFTLLGTGLSFLTYLGRKKRRDRHG